MDDQHAADPQPNDGRKVRHTTAAMIKPRRVRWLWEGRLAVGTVALLAGREGLGKSTVAYWLAARVSRGELPGEHIGQPKSVLVAATEDAWPEVIVPRLLAAGADMMRVHRVDVVVNGDAVTELVLPSDVRDVETMAQEQDAALLLLDPLISRLGKLDSHRDGETRLALEPLAAMSSRAGMVTLGLIHHNKSNAGDVLTAIMGSRAFAAVARSVHTVLEDAEEPTRRIFGTTKNNLGPIDVPSLYFTISAKFVGVDATDQTPISGSVVVWGDESGTSIGQLFADARDGGHTLIGEAVELLTELLDANGGCITAKQARAASRRAGLSDSTLSRARQRLGLITESVGSYPRTTTWTDPASVSVSARSAGQGVQ